MEFRVDESAFEHIRRAGLERSLSIDIEAGADAIEAVAGLRLFDGHTDTAEVMVAVLREILSWSKGRYLWQRDALRRLVVGGELSDEDLRTVAEICKAAHGLAEPQELVPFDQEHVPDGGEAGASVSFVCGWWRSRAFFPYTAFLVKGGFDRRSPLGAVDALTIVSCFPSISPPPSSRSIGASPTSACAVKGASF